MQDRESVAENVNKCDRMTLSSDPPETLYKVCTKLLKQIQKIFKVQQMQEAFSDRE